MGPQKFFWNFCHKAGDIYDIPILAYFDWLFIICYYIGKFFLFGFWKFRSMRNCNVLQNIKLLIKCRQPFMGSCLRLWSDGFSCRVFYTPYLIARIRPQCSRVKCGKKGVLCVVGAHLDLLLRKTLPIWFLLFIDSHCEGGDVGQRQNMASEDVSGPFLWWEWGQMHVKVH